MNIDLFEVMPGCVFRDGTQLMERLVSADRAARTDEISIENNPYPRRVLNAYRKNFLPENLGTSTRQVTELILKQMMQKGK